MGSLVAAHCTAQRACDCFDTAFKAALTHGFQRCVSAFTPSHFTKISRCCCDKKFVMIWTTQEVS